MLVFICDAWHFGTGNFLVTAILIYIVLGTKRQFLRYARVETSHLQKQTPYFNTSQA